MISGSSRRTIATSSSVLNLPRDIRMAGTGDLRPEPDGQEDVGASSESSLQADPVDT